MAIHEQLNVTQAILDWSQTVPMWQRDALRRIMTTAELSQEDESEVLLLAKAEYGAGTPPEFPPVPLAAEHMPVDTGADPIALVSIHNLLNVNALASDQSLQFAPEGLTIVYGENAAGKSGYSRVLKRSCRARDAEEILPNILVKGDVAAEAQLDVMIGEETTTVTWRDGATPPDVLSRIAIFDSKTSRVFLDEEDEVRFIPYGLDAFARLGSLCGWLKERLTEELGVLRASARTPSLEGETEAARLLAALTADSCPIDAAVLSHLIPSEVQEIKELREARGQDPALRAGVAQSLARRVGILLTKLRALSDAVSPDALAKLRSLSDAAAASLAASELARNDAFNSELLAGVGSEAWREMYEAAKRYSEEHAYPGLSYPVTESSSSCVLCQQPLVPPADERMRRFAAFMTDETAKLAQEKAKLLETARAALSAVSHHPEEDDETLLAELRERDETLVDVLESECDAMRATRDACLAAATSEQWDSVSSPTVTVVNDLVALSERLEKEAASAENSTNPVEQARIAARLGELESRQVLAGKVPEVAAAIRGKRAVRATEQCLAAAETTPITRRGGELQKAAVTEALRTRLREELKALGVTNVPVDVTERGSSGRRLHRFSMPTAVRPVKDLSRVLSEGEHRAVAIAAMLAECGLQDGKFPVVFDDPVSSLDHRYRGRVAARLVKEPASRQVIVLTHDVFFMTELQAQAESRGLPVAIQGLRRTGDSTGITDDGQPWQTMTVEQRLQWCDGERARLSKVLEDEGESAAYSAGVGNLVDRLRSTWERAIEEKVFNKVVTRFQSSVKVERLESVVFSDPDFAMIMAARDRLSALTPAHDEAAGAAKPVATPDDLKAEISELRTFVTELKTRQKAAKTSRVG